MNSETTMMAMRSQFSADFLTDLDLVCPYTDNSDLPLTFLSDLDNACAHAQVVSLQQPAIAVADLAFLAEHLRAWRSHNQRLLQRQVKKLRPDDPLLGSISLFGTMDYGRLETAHTRALAWLLDNRREHEFGSRLLEALVNHILGRRVHLTNVKKVESEYPISQGSSATGSGRIDIFAEGDWEEFGKEFFWRLAIEAKIDAEEGEEQLSQYDDWLEQNSQPVELIRVFLTPDGREPRTGSAKWQALSFVDLAGIFRHVRGLQDKSGYHFLRYYLTGVLQDICGFKVSIGSDCENPYDAVDYLRLVLGKGESRKSHGHSR
jgi:hypothetical protein